MDVHIAGGGLSAFRKRTEPMAFLMEEAAEEAFEEAGRHGISRESVDAVVVGILNPSEFLDQGNSAALIADHLGLTGAAAWRVETASSTGAAALHSACHAVLSGLHRNVLVLGGEKSTQRATPQVTSRLARMIDRSERRMGATMAARAALVMEHYRNDHELSAERCEALRGRIAVKNRRNGCTNPYAHLRRPITMEQHAASRPVSTPLRVLDCGPISDGAAALIVTAGGAPVRLAGLGHATDTLALSRRASFAACASTQRAAAAAYRMAGVGPGDIHMAEIHDAFTAIELFSAEDLGLFPPGGHAAALTAGRTEAGGDIPINLSGGLLSRGHPIGASGLAQVVEAHRRLGREGLRAGGAPMRAIALSMGGLATNNYVTIIEMEGAPPPADRPIAPPPPDRSGLAPIGALPPVRGTVRAASTLHNAPEGFEGPLHFGLVEGEAGGRRRTVLVRAKAALEAGEEVRLEEREEGVFVL